MRYSLLYLFSIVTLFVAGCVGSGGTTTSTTHQQEMHVLHEKQRARDLYYAENYSDALDVFLYLDSIKPGTPDNIYHIGICYLKLEKDTSLHYLEQCLSKADQYPEALHYHLGAAYHLNEKFKKAIEHYEIYKAHLYQKKGKHKDYKLIHEVNREIQMCENGIIMVQDKLNIEIISLSEQINSEYPDYAPVLTADEKTIIFTSDRPYPGIERDPSYGIYNEDIYISHKDIHGNWGVPQRLNINTPGQDASVSLSPDGHKLLLYHYNDEHLLARNSGDLYLSEMHHDTFSTPVLLPDHINSPHYESGASMSADGNTIYFSSNRKGSIGGSDIYIARKLPNGHWAEPENLGVSINTGHDEDSPFIHPDGKTLYFCSDGHHTMGGFDIFYSVFDDKTETWSVPLNIGYPINTPHDDIHFCLSADGTRIYFASARHNTQGDKDIYYATIKDDRHKLLVLKGFIRDSITQEPIRATITVRDKKTNQVLGIYNSNSKTGKYLVVFTEDKHYDITIEADGYELCTDAIDNYGLEEYEERDEDIILCPQKE